VAQYQGTGWPRFYPNFSGVYYSPEEGYYPVSKDLPKRADLGIRIKLKLKVIKGNTRKGLFLPKMLIGNL